jgi:hypothetical protein
MSPSGSSHSYSVLRIPFYVVRGAYCVLRIGFS